MSDKWKRPNRMKKSELREIVSSMSWRALDIAQHLRFTNEVLKDEYREGAYRRACQMAYDLASYPYDGPKLDDDKKPEEG